MDFSSPLLLTNILTEDEITAIPSNVQEKFKQYVDGLVDEYCKVKAAGSRADDYQQQVEELESKVQDYEVKLQNYAKSVEELRTQLDDVTNERQRLLDTANNYEREVSAIRAEKNAIKDEHNSLLQALERSTHEQQRQQEEINAYQEQLKQAVREKCKALARIDEVESKALSLELKERRIEQERSMLQNQIETLSNDLNRANNDLQVIRREHSLQQMRLETNLSERTEQLKILQEQTEQLKTTNAELTEKLQELTSKLFKQNEESNKMIEFYKKEVDAKSRMIDIYKNNANDTAAERNELINAIADLKRMLTEASEEYGKLETEHKASTLAHDQQLEEKEKQLEDLRNELKHANELLKQLKLESVDAAICKLAPSAAVASRLIRSDMSLTELYALYVKTSEELELQKRENARKTLELKTILTELTDNAPMLKRQEIQLEKLIETNSILMNQRDELLAGKIDAQKEITDAQAQVAQLERENVKLKRLQADLGRQVCYLLKQVDRQSAAVGAANSSMNGEASAENSTDEIISKHLVTFANIVELQTNNNKLLLCVRDLSTRLEELEQEQQQLHTSATQQQNEKQLKKVQQMQQTLAQQQQTIDNLLSKVERYKQMYFKLRAKNIQGQEDSSEDEAMQVSMDDSHKKPSTDSEKHLSKRVQELEQAVKDSKEQYKTLKEQHEYYLQEKQNNDKIMNEQFDSMRSEVRQLTADNCKFMSAVEHYKEQIKIQQKNVATYKQQINALEERNKNYETTNFKYEQTMDLLRNELMKVQSDLSATKSDLNHLQYENRLLKDTAARLQSEKEANQREQQQQNLLLSNLEIIKSNLERSEVEGRLRLEQQLDETVRELAAQRRRFQEDEDRYRELSKDLQRQTDNAKQRAEEEAQQSTKLRQELQAVREELMSKIAHIDALNKKLQDSLIPSKHDNPITLANKRAREFEVKYEEAKIENESLSAELAKSREHAEQYYRMSQSAESEIKKLHELHTSYVGKAEQELTALRLSEQNLKSKIVELESEIQLTTIAEQPGTSQPDEVKKLQEELRETLQKLSECQRQLITLRNEKRELAETLHGAETKYANEMMLHSGDIQNLTALKSEQSKLQDQVNILKVERDEANRKFEVFKEKFDESKQLLEKEKEELEKRLEGLDETNRHLHEQIEALTTKLAVHTQNQTTGGSLNASLSNSLNASDLNLTQTDEDGKNSEQWLQIIKFLRKEKDLTVAKMDIIKAENTRIHTEHAILQKKVEELKGIINQQQSKSETVMSSALKHEEVLRKIETLDAITDSNRILREERNNLAERVKELNERLSELETQLFPLQDKNRELSTRVEELTTENASLRSEAIKWRQRANVLVEKSHRNPEEFRRLQLDRENLNKLLLTERQQTQQLQEELTALRLQKTQMEAEHSNLLRQIQNINEEKRKHAEDVAAHKAQTSRLMQEIMELKNKLLVKEETMQKLGEELEAKEASLQDIKAKEITIRKIAKRYKDSYLELENKSKQQGTLENAAAENAQASLTNEPGSDAASEPLRNLREEHDKVQKELEELKAVAEVHERTKELLRETTQRIKPLKESNEAYQQELNDTKSKLKSVEENRDTLKTQYEQSYQQLQKEHQEQLSNYKDSMLRLTRDNESLLMRINQLQRQQGLQQSNKPSTSSSGAGIDKSGMTESSPRTANVKPMSGSSSVQQSATVTPWRGSETPLASIRPISVQNSRTAAILPTSQQAVASGGNSTSSSASSASSSAGNTSSSSSSSSSGTANTALVPPQQQVHTTGSSSSNLESMSASPTSSHADYIPSTSSASVTVATIPPMGTASVAESSQEVESGGTPQQQVVVKVSPRVENVAPNQLLDASNSSQQQQPSTSGGSSSVPLISHSRHTPSSSSVTTSQSPSASSAGHKRPRELDGDSSTGVEEHAKRSRGSMLHGGEVPSAVAITDSGADVEYQVPTSSQRDQEDYVVVLTDDDEDEDEDDAMGEADDGPAEGVEVEDNEEEGYEDSYEQEDQGVDEQYDETADLHENRCHDVEVEVDNNEVDVDEVAVNRADGLSEAAAGGSIETTVQQHDNQSQQSQTISSGSQETKQVATEVAGSSPQLDNTVAVSSEDKQGGTATASEENIVGGTEDTQENTEAEQRASQEQEVRDEACEEFIEEVNILNQENDSVVTENVQVQEDVQQSEADVTTEDNEGVDGVTSEGEKQVLEVEQEEGREAEASTSPTMNTRSKTGTRGQTGNRRPTRGIQRGNNRPQPIIWKDLPTHSRNMSPNQRHPEQSGSPMRGNFQNQGRPQRPRRMRRPGGNYGNMRFP